MHKKIFRGCGTIIVFGGSFDPIHLGHLEITYKLRELYPNRKIVIIPTYQNPLKKDVIACGNLRLQWIKTLLENEDNILIEDYELNQSKPNFSYKTVKYLYERYNPKNIDFVIGQDNLANLENWKNIDKLKKMINFILISRKIENENSHYIDNFTKIEMTNNASSSKIRQNGDYQYVPIKIKKQVKEFYENNK